MEKFNLSSVLSRRADGAATVTGSDNYPCVKGHVWFYQLCKSVLVKAEFDGLPLGNGSCSAPVFAFHIHEGTECGGNRDDMFADAKGHYNPCNCPHPYHAGDMPPLFGVSGGAFLVFVTDRFTVEEIMGRTVIVHRMSDDFHTQPSGNAGEKIACEVIQRIC